MVAAIVAREFLVSGLRLAAVERGVVLAGPRPRQAEDLVAGGRRRARRLRRRRCVEHVGRLVGAAGRGRADLGLRARLRPGRAGAPARPRARLSSGPHCEARSSSVVARSRSPDRQAVATTASTWRHRARRLERRPSRAREQRLALLGRRLGRDLDGHGRFSLKEHRRAGTMTRGMTRSRPRRASLLALVSRRRPLPRPRSRRGRSRRSRSSPPAA